MTHDKHIVKPNYIMGIVQNWHVVSTVFKTREGLPIHIAAYRTKAEAIHKVAEWNK